MEWISIEDRVPAYSERVLVTAIKEYETGQVFRLVDIADLRFTNKDGNMWMNDPDDLRAYKITHWMPLPEPFKQQNHVTENR